MASAAQERLIKEQQKRQQMMAGKVKLEKASSDLHRSKDDNKLKPVTDLCPKENHIVEMKDGRKELLDHKTTPNHSTYSPAGSNTGTLLGVTMSKPSSYFSIQEHTFVVSGRKEQKGQKIEKKELALYFEKEVLAYSFKPMSTVPERDKYIKIANLKEIANTLESGYPEETTGIILKEKGYKELMQTLRDHKILVLDFCQWVKSEIEKIPAKPKGRQKGEGSGSKKPKVDKSVQFLVSTLSSFAPNLNPKSLVIELKELIEDEDRVSKAIEILEEKEKTNGRDLVGYILLRIKNKKKAKK